MSFGLRIDIVSDKKIDKSEYDKLENIILNISGGKQTDDNFCNFLQEDNKISLESYNGVCTKDENFEKVLYKLSENDTKIICRHWVDFHTAQIGKKDDFLYYNGEYAGVKNAPNRMLDVGIFEKVKMESFK